MNPNQLAAATSPHPWNIILAGPGSGKTATQIERAKYLVSCGIDPQAMCFVTFTNIAANVMRRRLETALGKRVGYVGTLHGMMLSALRKRDPRLTLVGEADAEEFIEQHAKLLGYKGSAEALKLARHAESLIGNVAPYRVIASYRRFMRDERLLDYDMVLTEGLELMKEEGADAFPWEFWSVDEFQDSSKLDAAIYLARKPIQLFITGDSDQSIFRFRGAYPLNLFHLWNDTRFRCFELTENYRSTQEICDVANAVIALNTDRIEKKTESANHEVGGVMCCRAHDEEGERKAALQLARTWISNGMAPSSIAVLCRTNKLAYAMGEYLRGYGLPVAEVESEKKPKDWRLLNLIIAQIASPANWAIARLFVREQARILSHVNAEESERKLEVIRAAGQTTPAAMLGLPPLQVILSNNADFSRFGVSRAGHTLLAQRIRLFQPTTIETLQEALRASPEAKTLRGVNCITVHAAKGEEFEAVVIPGADMFCASDREDMEDERRLFFVAVTRAKRCLAVLMPAQRTITLPTGRTITGLSGPAELFEIVNDLVTTPAHA